MRTPEQSTESMAEKGSRSPKPVATPTNPTHAYSPGLSARLVAAAFVVPEIALFAWAAGALILQGHYLVGIDRPDSSHGSGTQPESRGAASHVATGLLIERAMAHS